MAPRVAGAFLLVVLLGFSPAMADFDYFHLILQWPGAPCSQVKCCTPTTGYPVRSFLISGFVTRQSSGDKPVKRCSDAPFDIGQITPQLRLLLELYWSSVFCPSSDGVFYWTNAWTNYGTCSGLTQPEYFQAALHLYFKINVLNALESNGIHAGDNALYSVDHIKSVIKDAIGASPGISCSKSPDKEGVDQLSAVYVCVDKDASTVIECPVPLDFTCSPFIQFKTFDFSTLNDTSSSTLAAANPIKMAASL